MEKINREHSKYSTDTLRSQMTAKVRETMYRLKKKTGLLDALHWKDEGFDLDTVLDGLQKPMIEIGGPSAGGFRLADIGVLKKSGANLFISDIRPTRGIDVQLDALQMPFADSSIGAIFMSFKPIDVETAKFAQEVSRVLDDGGLCIMRGVWVGDVEEMAKEGLVVRQYEWELRSEVREALRSKFNNLNLSQNSVVGIIDGIQQMRDGGSYESEEDRDFSTLGGQTSDSIIVYQKNNHGR